MNLRKNLQFLPEIEIWRNNITSKDLMRTEFDPLYRGYWIKPNSPIHTLLLLKGCKLEQIYTRL